MAARNKAWTPEKVRERIQTSMLINRLSDHALGKTEMSATQVRAAEILLKKAVPDLTSTELTGEIGINHDVTDKPMTPDEWEKQYADSLGAPSWSAESLN